MMSVIARLPRNAGSRIGEAFSVFMGRADVLDLGDLEALGITPSSNYVSGFMDEEEVEECFDTKEISPQIERPTKYEAVTTPEGETVVIQKDSRVRRMRVRR